MAALQCRFPVPASREDAQDRHDVSVDHEGDGQPTLEADNPKASANIVPKVPTLGAEAETLTERLNPFELADRDRGRGLDGNPVLETNQIVARLGGEHHLALLHGRPRVFAWHARMASNTCSADCARDGSFAIAS